MRSPSFWWEGSAYPAKLLQPLAVLYGAVAAWRLDRPGRAVGIPVICIGDLTIGGAGKTPAALAIAEILAGAGERPFFLTRGYGGNLAGPLRVDPARHTAVDVGDEPLLLARAAPTIVSRDRVAGAQSAAEATATIVVMDDGFQNPALAKDLAIVVIDGGRGVGNGRVFPAGPLRAPLAAQLARAHAAIIVGEPAGAASIAAALRQRALPTFHARLKPRQEAVTALAGRKVLAFAGIGNPEKFFATLAAAGVEAVVKRSFPDHHRYTAQEISALLAQADVLDAVPVTTEKDLARMAGDPVAADLLARARTLPVTLAFDDPAAMASLVLGTLRLKRD